MKTFFKITHDYINSEECNKMNKFLKENNVNWYAHGTDLESGVQDSGYIVGENVDFDKIQSYPWPNGVISVEFKTIDDHPKRRYRKFEVI